MIEIRNLTKKFGDFKAVDHLDLTIEDHDHLDDVDGAVADRR